MKTPSSEILIKAANYIERHGWLQGQYGGFTNGGSTYADGCAACAMGALNIVQGLNPPALRHSTEQAALVAVRVLQREGQVNSDSPYMLEVWNDEDGRTQAEVVALLRRAAEVEA